MSTTTKTATRSSDTDAERYVPMRTIRRRMTAERIVYVAGTVGLTIGPQTATGTATDAMFGAFGAFGAVGATGAWLWHRAGSDDHHGLLRTCQRALPVLTGSALYAASAAAPGVAWWELLLPATWGALMGWTTPITRSADVIAIPDAADPSNTPAVEAHPAYTYPEALAAMWEAANLAPGTRLIGIRQFEPDRPDFDATIVAEAGRPVPNLTVTALAAVFDLPEGTVTVSTIPGSGPGRMALTVAPTLRGAVGPSDLPGLWRARVSDPGGAAPGMHLIDHRVDADRIVIRVRSDDSKLINLPQLPIARALGMDDPDLLMLETDRLGDAVVSIYREHPLMHVREATREDLTMDEEGRIRIGLRHDGRPAHVPLYDRTLGAITDLFVGAPGAGKSVSLNTILAGERISGVVSIVADAQDGMSLPEANGRTYHFGSGVAAVLATLEAAYEVARHRQRISAEHGWGGFELNDPWPLANITLDEVNLILAADSDVPNDFKTAVTGLIAKFQSTGRKFGMGLRFAAQSIHLEDLGDKDKIRANAKNGTVSLGRTNSSTTQHMATDGVIPHGVSIAPIPRFFRAGNGIDAAFNGEEEPTGPVTAGMSWYIQGGAVFLMRTFRADKKNKTFPGLIALYESAPIPTLTPEEHDIFRAAYAEALPWAEALLAGETGDDADPNEGSGNAPRGSRASESRRTTARPATLQDRILALLKDGPMAVKTLRDALDATPTSVSNALTGLRDTGAVEPVSRGVWQLATTPTPTPDDE
ncbi:hypothetical protein [Embleya sp. NPDC020886]|uniref:hypothetical protein n=1 Tax=Embleya sp. NPDC020886 TaxID=3363980 RepID=UPI0037BCE29C